MEGYEGRVLKIGLYQKELRVVKVELWTGTERVEGCDGRVMDRTGTEKVEGCEGRVMDRDRKS